MKYLAVIFLLCLPLVSVGGTFEIADPAGTIYEEFQKQGEEAGAKMPEDEMICSINDDTNRCSCIHKESRQEISVKNEDCAIRALNASENADPEIVD